MIPISALTFVWNEEKNIARCLSHIKPYVDEIVIFDLESTDKTAEIARDFTDKVFVRPYLLCGDVYKMELVNMAKNHWLLWFYPDEVWPKKVCSMFPDLIRSERWTAYTFMRHEYIDNVRMQFERDGEIIAHGTEGCPNYQNRLHKTGRGIFYTELVHAELHGKFEVCPMPPEFYFEHYKDSAGQELDNVRLYIYYKYLVWKYDGVKLEPYRTYVQSYKKIIAESEAYNKSGERRIHPAEEEWWHWRDFELVTGDKIVDRALLGKERIG